MARFEPAGGYRCDYCRSPIDDARRSTRRFCDATCRQSFRRDGGSARQAGRNVTHQGLPVVWLAPRRAEPPSEADRTLVPFSAVRAALDRAVHDGVLELEHATLIAAEIMGARSVSASGT